MKKVLLVTFSDNADHQDTLFGMYEEMRKRSDWDAYLLCIKTPKVELQQSDHAWLVDCPERPGVTKKTFNLPLLLSIVHRIRRERFDAIYFESLHTWNLPIMMMSGKAKTYQVIHEVIPHEGDSQVKMVDLMNKAVVKFADTIVLRNKTYIQDMIGRYGISADRVKYLELWRRYPAYTTPVHNGRALFFGRINPYKGADNLLEIVRLCPDIEFDVIGRVDSQMQDVVDQLAKEKNVKLNNDYVTDEEMREAFINCDWVIVPYNSASQSGIIIDAYKYSRPVIAFAVGAIPEQVDDEKSGYLDAVAVCGNTVVGYTSDPKVDISYLAEQSQKIVRKNGYKVDVKILKDLKPYLERLDSMNEHKESLRNGIKFTPDERYPDLSREELIKHTILAICL